jgi:hypothetical protein
LPANGGTSTIVATVQDQQGNGIAGVAVAFSTDAGTLGSTSVVTDVNGSAATTLLTTATATVTASAGGGTGSTGTGTGTTAGTTGALTNTVKVTVQPRGSVSLTAPTAAVTVSTPMSLTVAIGAAVAADNVTLDFGDGESFPIGSMAPSESTNIGHIYGSARSFTATATAVFTDGTTLTKSVPVVVGDYTVSCSAGGNVAFGATSTLQATVTPTGMSISDYVWNFGDEGSAHGASTTHTWQSRGTKIITITVVPTKGAQKSATCSLEVN